MTSATRERLIAAGKKLFSQLGLGQVGLDHVLQQAELTKTTFYNHFSGKEELIREVINRHESELRNSLEEGLQQLGGEDARDQLHAIFSMISELHDEGATLLLNAIAEFPSPNDPTRLAAIGCKEVFRDAILSRTQKLGVVSPELLSDALVMVLDGALLNYQISQDEKTLLTARRMAELLINAAANGPCDS